MVDGVSRHRVDSSWPYVPYASCPCGSGAKAKFCCRVAKDTWFSKPRWKFPTLPSTGFDHPNCFARGDGACSQQISGEHYISESVLRVFGDEMIFEGSRIGTKRVRVERLTANILCTVHNPALSPLDSALKDGIKALRSALTGFLLDREAKPSFALSNGNDIEFAFLKTLCGLVVSGMVSALATRAIDPLWVQILFGKAPWHPRIL